MTDLPIVLIEVKSLDDIITILQMDNPLELAQIDDIIFPLLICEKFNNPMPIFNKLLEDRGFWVADDNGETLLEELQFYYRE